jgi:hypothetical protein
MLLSLNASIPGVDVQEEAQDSDEDTLNFASMIHETSLSWGAVASIAW